MSTAAMDAPEAVDPPWNDGFGPIPKTEAGIKAAIGGRLHLEWDRGEQCPVGRDPRQMTLGELESLGHRKEPLLRLIRRNCIDCAGGSEAEVRRCGMVGCPFWPYRMGSNPFAAERELSDAQRAALAAAAEARKHARIFPPASMPAMLEAVEASGGMEVAPQPFPAV